MIRDSIEHLERYSFIHPDMDKVIEFLKTALKKDITSGKYDISPDIFVNIMEYQTRPQDTIIYETHTRYADIQLVMQGEESHFFADQNLLQITEPYSGKDDIAFLKPTNRPYTEKILLGIGDFVVYFPEEAHAPSYNIKDTAGNVKKAVVKIRLN